MVSIMTKTFETPTINDFPLTRRYDLDELENMGENPNYPRAEVEIFPTSDEFRVTVINPKELAYRSFVKTLYSQMAEDRQ